ncbi:hypothetical protein D0Z00_004446 [Geotrichum galactomycetum]|uniref:Uncharacterized protein n=1 Tax=Geotrichum galactomycetum TaxID=27317 RepID=A0ACB6UYN7_9ASCO|nr:hypothetical protein D0Z00_004446 [Geotrichum candidum]
MRFYKPIWVGNTSLDLHVYVSDDADPASTADTEPILTDLGITFDSSFDDTVRFDVPIDGSEFVAANKSLYAHMFFSEAGKPWRPTEEGYNPLQAYVATRPLTRYIGPPKKVVKKHLLGGPEDEAPEPEENEVIEYGQPVPYYHPNVTIGLVQLLSPFKIDEQATWFQHFTPIERAENMTGPNLYFPAIYLNRFWQLHSQYIRINTTTTSIPLSVEVYTMSAMKFQMYHGIEEQKQQGTMAEMDKVKEILLDSNPYLLGITFIVSLLHSLFEFLAFKNDISHWRQKKDTIGVSVRSIVANVVMQTIIFLYLLDNNDNTSFMILFGQISGIVIEAWKITKVLDFKVENGSLVVKDKHELSEIEQKTKEYDEIIFKYMYIGAIPLILAYAAYALIYLTHKSWYSFVITTLVGSVYAYGFLMLVPAIYINYRLKSVAHMPRKAMVYKFLNTFIDDLFAFVIKMPLLHRLATLRDDIIFFIYLYQTWLYKVDYTRVNEFGQVGEEEENEKKEDEKKDEKEIGDEEPKKTK